MLAYLTFSPHNLVVKYELLSVYLSQPSPIINPNANISASL